MASFVGYKQAELLAGKVNDVQQHRGPDHQGTRFDDKVALAQQHLAIIDLSVRSNQPLEKDDYVIVSNGGIYNYLQLMQDLIGRRVVFKTESDTKVVLEMYRHHSEQYLRRLIGMFAFAIYNKSSGDTFLACDHFESNRCSYTSKDEKFAFASELKTLVATGVTDKQINYKSIVSALNYLWVSGNETMFTDCNKLPPAHFYSGHSIMQVSLD